MDKQAKKHNLTEGNKMINNFIANDAKVVLAIGITADKNIKVFDTANTLTLAEKIQTLDLVSAAFNKDGVNKKDLLQAIHDLRAAVLTFFNDEDIHPSKTSSYKHLASAASIVNAKGKWMLAEDNAPKLKTIKGGGK